MIPGVSIRITYSIDSAWLALSKFCRVVLPLISSVPSGSTSCIVIVATLFPMFTTERLTFTCSPQSTCAGDAVLLKTIYAPFTAITGVFAVIE